MYVTRRLSQVLKSPEILTAQPSSHGPNSGFYVIQDVESETYTCFGCCNRTSLRNLPFPQNKELLIRYTTFVVDKVEISEDPVFLIPLLNQPLSSNRYYAIVPHGKHKGIYVLMGGGKSHVLFESGNSRKNEMGAREGRLGWRGDGERRVKVNKVEKVKNKWSEFGCYALVERFNFRRMDGSLVMCYESYHFKQLHNLNTKWE